ncbi:hypothetical protein C8R46DRAFT_1235457 [Mycena filopes]|nr:hypothetical protein C8R46DRAFT_1235457 [Mycena filopes]
MDVTCDTLSALVHDPVPKPPPSTSWIPPISRAKQERAAHLDNLAVRVLFSLLLHHHPDAFLTLRLVYNPHLMNRFIKYSKVKQRPHPQLTLTPDDILRRMTSGSNPSSNAGNNNGAGQ